MSVACRLGLKWFLQDKSICKVLTCFVCVLMMWSAWGWRLGEVTNFYFSRGTKNWVFWHYQVQKAVWNKTFCESCVHLDITHSPVHMTRRFVIQGCFFGTKSCKQAVPFPILKWIRSPLSLISKFENINKTAQILIAHMSTSWWLILLSEIAASKNQ